MTGAARLPLLAKMLAILLPVTLVPLIILGIVSIRRGSDAVGHIAEQNPQLVASSTAARLDQFFTQTQWLQGAVARNQILIQALSFSAAERQTLLPEVESWLKEIVATNPTLALGYVADKEGVCIVSTSPEMVGRDYSKTRVYMRRALQGESVISDLAVGITTREPGVFFSGPVKDRGDRLVGVIVLKLKGEVVDRISIEVSKQTPGGFAVVIDANGVIISHPDPKNLYRSLGTLSPDTLEKIDPKLQYGIEKIEPGGFDEQANTMAKGEGHGYLTFIGAGGLPNGPGMPG